MWAWLYVIGGLVAALAGAFAFQNQFLTWALILVGILVGLFFNDTEDLTNFGVRYLLLGAVASALGGVPAVGSYLSGFFGGFFAFLGPVALTTLCVWFWKRYFASMM
jgi:uncharacterized membrane protein